MLHHELGGENAVHVDENGGVFAVRRQANLDLVRRDGDALHLQLAVHELLRLLTVAKRCVEVALHVHATVLDVFGNGATGDEHGKAEEIVGRHS